MLLILSRFFLRHYTAESLKASHYFFSCEWSLFGRRERALSFLGRHLSPFVFTLTLVSPKNQSKEEICQPWRPFLTNGGPESVKIQSDRYVTRLARPFASIPFHDGLKPFAQLCNAD